MVEEKPEEQATAQGDAVDVDHTDGAMTEAAAHTDLGNDSDAADSDDAPVDLEAELEAARSHPQRLAEFVRVCVVSVPVVGSVPPKACNRSSPVAIFGRYSRFCASLP